MASTFDIILTPTVMVNNSVGDTGEGSSTGEPHRRRRRKSDVRVRAPRGIENDRSSSRADAQKGASVSRSHVSRRAQAFTAAVSACNASTTSHRRATVTRAWFSSASADDDASSSSSRRLAGIAAATGADASKERAVEAEVSADPRAAEARGRCRVAIATTAPSATPKSTWRTAAAAARERAWPCLVRPPETRRAGKDVWLGVSFAGMPTATAVSSTPSTALRAARASMKSVGCREVARRGVRDARRTKRRGTTSLPRNHRKRRRLRQARIS